MVDDNYSLWSLKYNYSLWSLKYNYNWTWHLEIPDGYFQLQRTAKKEVDVEKKLKKKTGNENSSTDSVNSGSGLDYQICILLGWDSWWGYCIAVYLRVYLDWIEWNIVLVTIQKRSLWNLIPFFRGVSWDNPPPTYRHIIRFLQRWRRWTMLMGLK
jgi:hypothetical protein